MLVLNEGQKAAYNGFKEWLPLSIKVAPLALLEGSAGTGKTTVTMEMARLAEIMEWNVRGAAKTCKAAAVLHEKGGIVTSSIAALLNGGGSLEQQSYGKGLLIVDEASMIDDIELAHVLKLASDMGYKVLLVGDGCQLPPISDEQNVFGREVVFKPGLTPFKWKLTQVMRQQGQSGVLAYATAIRGTQSVLKVPATGMEDIRVVKASDMIEDYIAALNRGENVMMLDKGNTDRKYHNEQIRRILGETREIQVGETLVSLRNIKQDDVYVIQNSTIWQATPQLKYVHKSDKAYTVGYGSEKKKETVHLHFITDYVYNDNVGYETEFPIIIADSLPVSSWHDAWFYPTDWPTEVRQKYCRRVTAEENKQKGKKAKDTWELKPGVIVGTFGYSLTCHKAQGSQADTVYIASGSDDWRWLYTAVTRAAKKLVLSDSFLESIKRNEYSAEQIFAMAEKYGQQNDPVPYTGKYADLDTALAIANYHVPKTEQYAPNGKIDEIVTGMLQYVQHGTRKFSSNGLHVLAMANLIHNPKELEKLEDLIGKAKKLPEIEDYRKVTNKDAGTLYNSIYARTKTANNYGYATTTASMTEHPFNFEQEVKIFVQTKQDYIGYGYSCGTYFWCKIEKAITLEEAYEKVANEVAALPEELNLTIEGSTNLQPFTHLRRAVWNLSESACDQSREISKQLFAAITLDEQKNGNYGSADSQTTIVLDAQIPLFDVDGSAKTAAEAGRSPESEVKQIPLTDPKDARIAELEKQLAERDAKIAQIAAERDKAIAERDAAIEQFKAERARADKTAADLKAFNKRFADFLFAQ